MRPSLKVAARWGAAGVLVLVGLAAFAGEARADRPFRVTSRAYVTDPGHVFVEAGVLGLYRGSELKEFGTVQALTVGVFPRVEVFAQTTLSKQSTFGVEEDEDDSFVPELEEEEDEGFIFPEGDDDDTDRRLDFLDPFVGVRILVVEGYLQEAGDWPSVVLDLVLLFPGTRKQPADHLGFDAIIEASYGIAGIDLHVNVGYELQEDDPQHSSFFYSGAVYLPIPPFVTNEADLFLVLEVNGEKVESEIPFQEGLVGLVLQMKEFETLDDLYFDVAAFRSLATSRPEWGFSAGVSVGF